METTSLAEHFQRYFQLQLVHDQSHLAEVQRLRYRVYCEEFRYEDASGFPDRRERDPYDDLSFHAFISHKVSGQIVASIRLIPALPSVSLPFEMNAARSFEASLIAKMPRESMCEISRLCVDPHFRRRPGESTSQFGNYQTLDLSPGERRLLPFIGISMLLAGTALTFLTERRNIFAMMEPFLPKAMEPIGIHFDQIGRPVDYHGTRALHHVRSENVFEKMKPELKELFFSLYDILKPSFQTSASQPMFDRSSLQAL